MVLETIILSSALGYLTGTIIGEGMVTTSSDDNIKVVTIDFKKGYQKSLKKKKFRAVRDIALMSGVGCIYARSEQKAREMRARRDAEKLEIYDSLCKAYDEGSDKIINRKCNDYKAVFEHITSNPSMNKRTAYITKPFTLSHIGPERFDTIYEYVQDVSDNPGQTDKVVIKDFADFCAISDFRREKEFVKEMAAKELLAGGANRLEGKLQGILKGDMPIVRDIEPLFSFKR